MSYSQITHEERFCISFMRKQGLSSRAMAKELNRSHTTISREIKRNSKKDGRYRLEKAIQKAENRKSKTRKKKMYGPEEFGQVLKLLKKKWSPEQISNVLKITGILDISIQTIYTYIKRNRRSGGEWYKHLRQSRKRRRKGYGNHDSRGVMRGKRELSERPEIANARKRIGDYELDTVWGSRDNQHSILTMVDRKTGYVAIGKLSNRTTKETNRCMKMLMKRLKTTIKTATLDNGTEFHQYKEVEKETGVTFYFCQPYHSWERGPNENTNGLIRQYLPKGQCMKNLTQRQCDSIATQLNQRPRKRLGYKTPEELYV